MSEQQKIYRVLKLISLLKDRAAGRTVENLAGILETSERTVYRYLQLLEDVGIEVETTITGGRKFIPVVNEKDQLNIFTADEANLLKDLVLTGSNKPGLTQSILQKLYINSELTTITDELVNGRNNLIKTKLVKADNQKKQVLLKNYHSVHSGKAKDYLIEPFRFTENYTGILAFDVKEQMVKHFKLGRMSEAIVLDKDQQFEELHTYAGTDIFNFTGDSYLEVHLKLSFQAYMLLREEYPKSIPYISKGDDNIYHFIAPVHHLYGVGRFVLGMLDEVVIVKPPELKAYVMEKLQDYLALNDDREWKKDAIQEMEQGWAGNIEEE